MHFAEHGESAILHRDVACAFSTPAAMGHGPAILGIRHTAVLRKVHLVIITSRIVLEIGCVPRGKRARELHDAFGPIDDILAAASSETTRGASDALAVVVDNSKGLALAHLLCLRHAHSPLGFDIRSCYFSRHGGSSSCGTYSFLNVMARSMASGVPRL